VSAVNLVESTSLSNSRNEKDLAAMGQDQREDAVYRNSNLNTGHVEDDIVLSWV
jgi:hypothetical protein